MVEERDTRQFADLGGFGILLAMILLTALVGVLAYSNGYQNKARSNLSERDQTITSRDVVKSCSNGTAAVIAECVYDEITLARDRAIDEQDLDAQQWMVIWSGVLVFLTGVTTLISWIALHYLRGTLEKTAEAAQASTAATIEMNRANHIAANAQRPWLTISVELYDGIQWTEAGLRFDILVTVKNVGMSAATEVYIENQIIDGHDQKSSLSFLKSCAEKAARINHGDILIPGETRTIRTGCLMTRASFEESPFVTGDGFIVPCVSVSVVYKSGNNDAPMQTGRTYIVMRAKDEHPGSAFALVEREGDLPKNLVWIETAHWGGNCAT